MQTMTCWSVLLAACLATPTPPWPEEPHRWRNAAIVGGGFVTGVISHPRAPGVVFARTDIGGAYRRDAGTGRWVPLLDWLPQSRWNEYGVESLALDPQDPSRVYLAVGTYTNSWAGNGTLLRSDDGGRTWKTTPLPFQNGGNMPGRSIGERLAVDPKDGRVLLFGTRQKGLWRSTDRGATLRRVEWFPAFDASNGVGVGWVLFDPNEGGPGPTRRILTGTGDPRQPVFESLDGGSSWHPLPGSPQGIPHHAALAADGTLYLTFCDAPGPNGVTSGSVWRRNPSGQWSDITPVRPTQEKGFGYAGLSLDARRPGTLIVSTLCRWGADTIFRSTDGGETWISLAETSLRDVSKAPYLRWDREEADFGHWIGDCEIDPHDSNHAWYVTGATIYETRNLGDADQGRPTRWFVGCEGLEETAVLDLVSPPKGPWVVSGLGDIGGFLHFDLEASPPGGMFTNPLLSNIDDWDFAELRPQVLLRVGRSYGGNRHGSLSRDGGQTWTPLASDPPGSRAGGGSAALSADGSWVVWSCPPAAPARTRDGGSTWEPCRGLPVGSRVISDRVDPRVFYAVSTGQRRLYRSVDSGATFQPMAMVRGEEVHRPQAVFGRRGHLWVPTSEGLFRSTDGGRTLHRVEGLERARAVGFGRAAPGRRYPTVFVIGAGRGVEGVFRSTDEGRTWVRVNDASTGFGTMSHVCGDPKRFGRVYVGTNGRGVLYADPVRP